MKFFEEVNNYRNDRSGWTASFIMLIFALIAAYRWHTTDVIFFALLVLRDLAASWFLLTRKSNEGKANTKLIELLAYISSAVPFFYFNSNISQGTVVMISSVIAIIGFAISTIALLDLGRSFGVSPANRGLVSTGLYRYINHPMYIGYAISEFSFIFLNPLNAIVWLASTLLYFLRTRIENKTLHRL